MDSASVTGIILVIYVATIPTMMAMMARARGLSSWLWWFIGLLPFINVFGFVLLAIKSKDQDHGAKANQERHI